MIKQLQEKRNFEEYEGKCFEFREAIIELLKKNEFKIAYAICGQYYEYLYFTDVDDETDLGKEMHYRRIGWVCGITDFIDLQDLNN